MSDHTFPKDWNVSISKLSQGWLVWLEVCEYPNISDKGHKVIIFRFNREVDGIAEAFSWINYLEKNVSNIELDLQNFKKKFNFS